MKDLSFVGIIPARFASTRFPGKPLAMIGGKMMIQRVWERACSALDEVYVATDDKRIFDAVESFGGKCVMTKSTHKSGTDRCLEAYINSGSKADVIINIQGDEPFISKEQIDAIKGCFDSKEIQIATLAKVVKSDSDISVLENPNSPKLILDKNSNAIYFSRSIIPYLRNIPKEDWIKSHTYYTHIGMYAYRKDVLAEITQLPQSTLEISESLEQLRWLENGYKIKVGITEKQSIGIDRKSVV